jgi:hypothetical protein
MKKGDAAINLTKLRYSKTKGQPVSGCPIYTVPQGALALLPWRVSVLSLFFGKQA